MMVEPQPGGPPPERQTTKAVSSAPESPTSPDWLIGASTEQQRGIEAVLTNLEQAGHVDRHIMSAVVTELRFTDEPLNKPESYQFIEGRVRGVAYPDGRIVLATDFNPTTERGQHFITHEISHQLADFIRRDKFDQLTNSRDPLFDTHYTQRTKEKASSEVVREERLAEDLADWLRSPTPADFIARRLQRLSTDELTEISHRYGLDAVSLEAAKRKIDREAASGDQSWRDDPQLKPLLQFAVETEQLFTFFGASISSLRGKSPSEIKAAVAAVREQKLGGSFDTEGYADDEEVEGPPEPPPSLWQLIFQFFQLVFEKK